MVRAKDCTTSLWAEHSQAGWSPPTGSASTQFADTQQTLILSAWRLNGQCQGWTSPSSTPGERRHSLRALTPSTSAQEAKLPQQLHRSQRRAGQTQKHCPFFHHSPSKQDVYCKLGDKAIGYLPGRCCCLLARLPTASGSKSKSKIYQCTVTCFKIPVLKTLGHSQAGCSSTPQHNWSPYSVHWVERSE